jgi:hypothetical protein
MEPDEGNERYHRVNTVVIHSDSRRSNLEIAESPLKLSGKGIVTGWDSGKTERHRRGKLLHLQRCSQVKNTENARQFISFAFFYYAKKMNGGKGNESYQRVVLHKESRVDQS